MKLFKKKIPVTIPDNVREQLKPVENFLKEGFQINGTVKAVELIQFKDKKGFLFELKDQEKGNFFIAMIK